ncbi:MAG TPA: hypothetical protein VF666_04025 [Pyrinomonadaceae bacterium]|jgi:hypothetical protein
MRKFPELPHAATFVATTARRRALFLFVFVLFLLSTAGTTSTTRAQSGRRSPKNPSPLPSPTPAPAPAASSSTDEKPKTGDAKTALHSFVVYEDTNVRVNLPLGTNTVVARGFVERMREAADISVTAGGRSDRGRAREAAKKETTAFVVVVQLDEVEFSRTGQVDPSNLVVRYFVYEPATGTLKHQGNVYLRPYQSSARVGGMRLPLPGGSRSPMAYEYILEQAGSDAADRVLGKFNIRLPDRR